MGKKKPRKLSPLLANSSPATLGVASVVNTPDPESPSWPIKHGGCVQSEPLTVASITPEKVIKPRQLYSTVRDKFTCVTLPFVCPVVRPDFCTLSPTITVAGLVSGTPMSRTLRDTVSSPV